MVQKAASELAEEEQGGVRVLSILGNSDTET